MNSSLSQDPSPVFHASGDSSSPGEGASLRQHETFFRLIENAPFGVYLVDGRLRLVEVSAGARRIFKLENQHLGRRFEEVIAGIWRAGFVKEIVGHFQHTFDTGESFSLRNSSERRIDTGLVESHDWKIERVPLPDGSHGVVCYFYDVTERQTAIASASFLAHLSQMLAVVTDVAEIIRISTEAVAKFLDVHRCYYVDIPPQGGLVEVLPDWRKDGPDLAGFYELKDFGSKEWLDALYHGPVAINDVQSHPWTAAAAGGYAPLRIRAYAMVPFVDEGRWVAALGISSDEVRSWTADDLGLMENVIARVWPLIQRAHAAEALKASEGRYRTLFESIDEGFCTVEVIFDAAQKPVDYRFLQGNPAFERMTGLSGAFGKTARELVPDLEEFWFEAYGRAALTGETVRFENYSAPMARWFDVHASRIGGPESRQVAILFNNITERKVAAGNLARLTAASEQQRRLYETVLSSTPDLAYVWGLDHRFTYANEALLKMWGTDWEHARGKHCLELGYEPWHAAMHDEEIERVIATRQPLRGEVPFNGTHGRRIYDYILVPVFGINGQVEAVAGTTRDVTDRRQAEEDVRSRTAQFETLLNQAPLGVYLIDDEFRISHVNPSARPVFGDIPDLIGRDFDEVIHILWHATYADELVRVFRHTLQTGEPHTSAERREERLDLGRTEYYEWRTDRIILPNGAFGVVCYFQDISAQVKARERIAESEERFRTLVSVITEVPWVADAFGMFVTPQSAWEHYTGQTWEQHRDLRWANAVHPEDRVRFLQRWQHACQSATLFECEGRLWHADSSQWRYFAARATPVLTDRNKVREWVGACTDVDGQKRTESALRLARDEAEKSSRAKDHFMAVLSHELRTPLTPVLMAVAALEHDPQLPADAREELSMVRRNIELETKLIDDLLDLSRITTGKLALKLETVDLHQAILRVCGICKPQAREQGVKLSFGPCSSPIHLQADAARLQQVLWNVVRNAIKFTPEDGRVDITTSVLSGGRCEVRVLDNGVGIPAAALPHIFDAFEQGGAAVTRQFGGMGLGLAISASLVALHGGTIRAESPGEGQGSTFVIELQCNVAPSGPSAGSGIGATSAASPRQGTLLLVEDNEDTLRTLARMLRKSGFGVLTASSVAEGVAAVSKGGFDLLVSDLGLPDGQGHEVMRHLAETSTAPGIAMSGYGMEEDMRLSREAGFSEHLVKPVDFRQLLAAVERALPKTGTAE